LLTARTPAFEVIEARQQFPGGGIFGGPGFGIGGFAVGSGGLGFGTGGFQAAGSGIGPVLTLESEFGVGFTSRDIADAILAAEQEGRFTSEGPVTGAIVLATGPTLTLVLNLARGLFELFNASGQKVGGGVTPEAAIEAARAGAPPPLGGGGGSEPLPFPRRSDPLPRLRLSHLRRSPRPSVKTSSAPSRRSSQSSSRDEYRRRAASRPSRQASPSNPSYLVEQSISPSFWARRVIPPEYVVHVFQIRSNSAEAHKSVESSLNCSGSEKPGRTRTSNAEHSNNSSPLGWN